MPYDRIDQLPDSVRNHLPTEAQQIYKEAFNHAWEEYSGQDDREATAHKVAWSAVKKKYHKQGDKWVAK
ncbi:ChaB family protein [Thiohalophilus sp.]|uniref:ChaB family protein n=1 Tax=Thiohalophilus sp. TaxID=3028392 RepID=UPI002ACEFB53|nr:ChaB family protein [Thiohalophilus sp.]MDZ7804980.1 ChaB family protein [Thiohalophilus sp.]